MAAMGPPIIGCSENIQRVKELVDHVAHTGLNIVIFGESGVGKEVVAQNLYQKSPRLEMPHAHSQKAHFLKVFLKASFLAMSVGHLPVRNKSAGENFN